MRHNQGVIPRVNQDHGMQTWEACSLDLDCIGLGPNDYPIRTSKELFGKGRDLYTSIQQIKWPVAFGVIVSMILLVSMCLPGESSGQEKFQKEPILYSTTKPTDPVQKLADLLTDGEEKLQWSEEHGYLVSILEKLKIPVSSQSLVFSKTSLQVSRITPQTPRAVYFNDDIYIGWVQHGNVIEISAADPKLGATFYSLKQEKADVPVIRRETARCLQCHGATHTRGRPGHIVRSVFPNDTGMPEYSLGTNLISHQSEFHQRFGGWYVTGTHGELRHRGNSWLPESDRTSLRRNQRDQSELDIQSGANAKDLESFFDTSPYLTSHSDIVAMMVLQHQVFMHNIITEASYSGQQAAYDLSVMNKVFERDPDFESDSTRRRYDSAAEKVVQALLFCGEEKLTSPIKGSSEFASDFESLGPVDSKGRSLREFDLTTRMFKYPCSFLIYSESFRRLPVGVLSRVRKRLDEVLSSEQTSEEFEHLSTADRLAIREILRETGALE